MSDNQAEVTKVELKVGDVAPTFELLMDDGTTFNLKENLNEGQSIILYFYPKDDTPGCTTEACNFRDNMELLSEAGALVYGISPDTVAAHEKFINKFELNFPLLADENAEVAKTYGVWKEKNMYGRKYWGVERTTFLINPDGTIGRIWRKVKPANHAEDILKSLSAS